MMDGGGGGSLQVDLGFATETGRRGRNEDFLGACLGNATQRSHHGIAAAIADGMGGAQGGREAAESVVRGFLDGYFCTAETLPVQVAASQVLEALNRWVFSTGRTDPDLAGMGCTFTALILKGAHAHVIHVGDTRLYRLTGNRLILLTEDHTLKRPEQTHVLYRAMGVEATVRLDYARHPVEPHDRFLLCCDGVHATLPESTIAAILGGRSAPEDTAREIVAEALALGSDDNASALVVDVLGLPPKDRASIGLSINPLPIGEPPRVGDTVDGFLIRRQISDGRYSRVFLATDGTDNSPVALKFPHPRVTTDQACKAAFIREAWVTTKVRSPWVGRVIELPPGRQSCLYTVMPFYDGETLERRIRRGKALTLEEARDIAVKLGKAVATLHRSGIIHRDIKPDNVILEQGGGLKLVDLGAALVPGLDEPPPPEIPGTPSFMAPELFSGHAGCEKSDLFALGVTIFAALTGVTPYGEFEPFSHPRFGRPKSLAKMRPDLPSWLDAVLAKAFAVEPAHRHGDVVEFAMEMENGPAASTIDPRRPVPLYHRNPLLFWQTISAVLAAALVAMASIR